jgi:hypothetical protein
MSSGIVVGWEIGLNWVIGAGGRVFLGSIFLIEPLKIEERRLFSWKRIIGWGSIDRPK